MTPEQEAAIIQVALKTILDAAITLGVLLNKTATIDDAIAALQAAKTKTAADYIAEAKLATVAPPPLVPA